MKFYMLKSKEDGRVLVKEHEPGAYLSEIMLEPCSFDLRLAELSEAASDESMSVVILENEKAADDFIIDKQRFYRWMESLETVCLAEIKTDD